MQLSALKVLELNEFLLSQGKKPLVEGLCDRELENPEGVELELRVGQVWRLKKDWKVSTNSGKTIFETKCGFLGVEKRDTPEGIEIGNVKTEGNKKILMYPGEYFRVRTMETINCLNEKISIEEGRTARYLIPQIHPRRTLFECGIGLFNSTTNPGYNGQLTFGMANSGDLPFAFELGARMFKIGFEEVCGEMKRGYEGQWQGGKRNYAVDEKQI